MKENKFVLADPGTCIGCKTCMAACLVQHYTKNDIAMPRLNLVTTINVSAPIVCHHCDDAPCVASCPVGALYFDEGRVAVKPNRCIGCRSCEMACPFGAVEIVSKRETDMIGDLRCATSKRPFPVKCDLCADVPEGPRCVAACPTNSLHVVDGDMREWNANRKRVEAATAEASLSSVPLNAALVS